MVDPFYPLDPDLRHRELVYVSKAKLDQLHLPDESQGFGLSLSGFGANTDTRKRGTRELLNQATNLFRKQEVLSYERDPQPDQWFLLRAVLMCGTAWPAFGDASPADETAWWIGSSDSARVLAYGNRKHLLGQGAGPHTTSKTDSATWCPSRADAYLHLLKDISVSTQDDQLVVSDPWSDDASAQVRGLEEYFFSNYGVYRNYPLVDSGIYEMMLRVDRVVEDEDSVTVLGSPLWVARERRAVPGVYNVSHPSVGPGQHIAGSWDGSAWRSFEIRQEPADGRVRLGWEPSVKYLAPEDLGFEPEHPTVTSINYLGTPRWPEPPPRPQLVHDRVSLWQRFIRGLRH